MQTLNWKSELENLKRFAKELEGKPELPLASPEQLEEHNAKVAHFQELIGLMRGLPHDKRPPLAQWDDVLGPLWRRLFAKGDDISRYTLTGIWQNLLAETGESDRLLRTLTAAQASARNFYLFDEALALAGEGRKAAARRKSAAFANMLNTEGSVHYLKKDFDAATSCYQEALELAETLPEEEIREWVGIGRTDFVAQEKFNLLEVQLERGALATGAEKMRIADSVASEIDRLENMGLSEGFSKIFGVTRTELAVVRGDFAAARKMLSSFAPSPSGEGPYRLSMLVTHHRLMSVVCAAEGNWGDAYEWIRMAMRIGVSHGYPGEEQQVLEQALKVIGHHDLRTNGASEQNMLTDLVQLLEEKDWYTGRSHSRGVSWLATRMGDALNETNGHAIDIDLLESSGLMHDIGKLMISWSLLNKISPITPKERHILQQHCTYGGTILRQIGLDKMASIVEQHHEKVDGNGYPTGSKPGLSPAIVGLCDVFEASVTPNRRYKKPKSRSEVLREVKELSGIWYDPFAVEALLKVAEKE